MDGKYHYELRLSRLWQAVFIGAGVLSLGMVVDSFETGDAFTILASLAFFGFGGLVMLKVMLRNKGTIDLTDDGLRIDSYITTGFIPWEHFQSAQSLRVTGVSYLGLSTSDPQAYINSRQQLSGLQHEGDRVLAGGFTRIMMGLLGVLPPAKSACSFLLSVLGYAPLPKQFNELSLMEWSRDSYGSNLLIHRMWLPEFAALLEQLQRHARKVPAAAQPLQTQLATDEIRRVDAADAHASEPSSKACPMCAERIQPAARICRFCRYSFDEDRLLPHDGLRRGA